VTQPTTVDLDPACTERTGEGAGAPIAAPDRALVARRVAFDDIPRATWDACAARSPLATPFARWSFHRAWWDAYGANAHDDTLVVTEGRAVDRLDPDSLVAIVPLMHRHAVEPTDAATHTSLRRPDQGSPSTIAPAAKVLYFGASYHADYATILAAPDDLAAVAQAVAVWLATPPDPTADHPEPWDALDLRRLRAADPALDALASALSAAAPVAGWEVGVDHEDVCPVATLPDGTDFDGFLATLGKKERHEIRRKIRRAEAAGALSLDPSRDPLADLDAFIDLHQRRWGADGLFPPTEGGAMSRRFFARLFELAGADGGLDLRFLTLDGRRIAAGVGFETADTVFYYNAGVDPDARELSPGVLMVALYVRDTIERGKHRLDFLRGDEPYKYEWGAVDEPIRRILVTRT
jgi:CelD/BcsL family acetyltransferase involved in cellulose biosynthesis